MATTLREVGFKLGYDIDKSSEQAAENSIKSLKDMATKALGAIGIGFSLVKINSLIEEFGAVNDGIRSVVGGLEEAGDAQQMVLKYANESRTSYAEMAKTVSNLSKAGGNLFPIEEAAAFSSTVTKLMKTAGRDEATVTGVMEAMNKSFQKGIVDSETLNQMLEKAPETADVLAKHLGVAKSQLLDMASKGTMQVNDLKDAFLSSADEIDAAFSNVDLRVTDGIKHIRNSWGLWLADMDKSLGVTNSIARAMVKVSDVAMAGAQRIKTRIEWVAEKLGGTEKLLKLLAIAAGAVFLALNGSKILSFLKTAGTFLNAGRLKTLAIIAAIVLLALLVEDFFAFMKGENSLIGEMLERAGIDTDAFRQSCKDLWEQVKEIIGVFKQFARTIGTQLLSALKQILPLLGKLVAAILPVILQLVKRVVDFVGRLAQAILPMIVSVVERLLPFLIQVVETILPILITMIETLLPLFMQIIDAVLPVIISLVETLLPLVLQIIEAVLPVILSLIEAIVPILVQIVETILPVVIELIAAILPVLQPIFDIVSNLVSAVLPLVVSLLNAILPILQPILGVLQPIADVLGVIIGAISKVVGWVASGLGWIVDLIFGGGGGGPDASGANAVNAYARGTDNSSDTFIAGEEGPELVTGAGGRKIFTALETGNIFRAMAMLGKAAAAKPSTISNTTSSRTVNQYNEFVNTFNGDRAGQKRSSEAMTSASENATSEMARALAFAR